MEILAQVESLSGGAGWVGAGLLGLVLGWLLLKHLPDKDRQLADLIKASTDHSTKKDDDCRTERKEMFTQFDGSLKSVLERSSHDSEMLAGAVRSEMKTVQQEVGHFSDVVKTLALAIEKLGDKT